MQRLTFLTLDERYHPAILLFTGFFTGTLFSLIFAPTMIPLELLYGEFRLSWETLVAGVLGLIGGACAFIATRWERHQKEKVATFRFYEQTRALLPALIKYLTSKLEALQNGEIKASLLDQELLEYFERMIPESCDDLPLDVVQAHSRLMAVIVGIRTPVSIVDQDTDIHRDVLEGAIFNSIIFTMELQTAIEKHGRNIRF